MNRDEYPQPDQSDEPDDLEELAGADDGDAVEQEEHGEAEDGAPAEHEEGGSTEDAGPAPRVKVAKDEDGRTQIYKRGSDGEWMLTERSPVSDDPAVNAIGDLNYEEVEAILENEDDPRHELAKEYFKQSNERMMQSLRPITDQYRSLWKNVIGSSTAFDLVKKVPVLPEPIVPKSVFERSSLLEVPEVPDVALPRNPTFDVLEEQRAMNSAIVETNGHLAGMVAQAKTDAESSAARAAEERVRGQRALAAAWVAAAAAVVVPILLDVF